MALAHTEIMKALEVTLKLDVKSYRFDVCELEDNEIMTEAEMKETAYESIVDCLKQLGRELAEEGEYSHGPNKASASFKLVEANE